MMSTKISRHRCVMCGKLRKDKFLFIINERWICNKSVGYKNELLVKFGGSIYSMHPCKMKYLKSLFFAAANAIDIYNNAINNKDLIWFSSKFQNKKDIPEPTFFLQ